MGARTRHRPSPDEAVRSVDAGMVFVTEHRNSNVMCLVAAGVGVSVGCFALEYFTVQRAYTRLRRCVSWAATCLLRVAGLRGRSKFSAANELEQIQRFAFGACRLAACQPKYEACPEIADPADRYHDRQLQGL